MAEKNTKNKVTVQLGEELFSFSSKQEWINKAQSWFTQLGCPPNHYICIDNAGRICTKGAEFMRATAENTYPITVYVALV
jgi:alpha-tubulin suppressor-like RCC1 family protein